MSKKSIKSMAVFKSKVSQETVAPKEIRVTIEPCDTDRLQEQYARAHQSTGLEALFFVISLSLLICCFFAAIKFL